MYSENTRTFWCAVNDSNTTPFRISVHVNDNVYDLKKEIKKDMALHDVAVPSLALWMLSVPEPVEPARTLGLRIGSRGDVTTFANELASPTQKMSSVFPSSQLPVEDHVHILVDLPPSGPIVVV